MPPITAWYWCPVERATYSGPVPGPHACTVDPTTELAVPCACGHPAHHHVTNLKVVRCVSCMDDAVKAEAGVERHEAVNA